MARDRSPRASDPVPAAPRWLAPVIILAAGLTYANSVHGPFILDDQAAIAQNLQIRALWPPGDLLFPDAESPVAGRPLVNVSLAINYAAGGLDVRGYHVVNIGLHVVCALLAFGLIRRTLRVPTLPPLLSGSADRLAFAAALIWAVHPLTSEVVDYLTQRSESMMAICYLLTLYAANRALAGTRRTAWQATAIAACAAGMLCKETMATAPLVVALYDRAFAFPSWREAVYRRRGLYLGLAGAWLVLGTVIVTAPRAGSVGLSTGVSPWTYLLNQALVIPRYLGLSVWPHKLVAFYGWPLPLTLGDVLPYAAGLVAAAAVTVVAFLRSPALGFLGAWFFITLAPASSLVPIATEVGAERRMYIPLLGLVLLLVLAVHSVWNAWAADKAARVVALAPAALLIAAAMMLASTTMVRNREYASPLSLAETVVARRPTAIAYHILGEQLLLGERDADAVAPLTEAVSRGDSRAGYFLGVALSNSGQLDGALQQLEAFVRTSELPYRLVPRWLEPSRSEVVNARMLMARIMATRKQWNNVADQTSRVLALNPGHPDAQRLLATALVNVGIERVSAGDINAAVDAFRRAAEADPANTNARALLAIALKDQQRPPQSVR